MRDDAKKERTPLAQGKPDPKLLMSSGLTNSTVKPSASEATAWSEIDWVGQGARISALGKEKGAQLTELAAAFIKRGGETAQETQKAFADPEKRIQFFGRYGRFLKIGGSAVVVCVALGYWGVSHEAGKIADKNLQTFLNRAGLSDFVHYSSVSATPWGSVTLHDVSISHPGAAGLRHAIAARIGTLKISGVGAGNTLPKHLSLSASNIECMLNDGTVCLNGSVADSTSLRALGFRTLTGDASLSYALHGDRIDISTSGNMTGAFNWGVETSIRGISDQILANLAALAQSNTGMFMLGMFQMVEQLQDVAISKADVRIDNRGLYQRRKAVPDTAFPVSDSVPSGLAPIEKWNRYGGKLKVHMAPDEPIPIMRRSFFGGSILNPDLFRLDNLMRDSHATVSVD